MKQSNGHPQKKQRTVIVSGTFAPTTLLETIFDQDSGETAFLIVDNSVISRRTAWKHDGKHFRPIKATNNLIRHGSIRFASDASEYGTVERLLDEIDRYIARYVTLTTDSRHLVSAYVLMSWVYDAFNELPYLRFRGDYGTGKTRALLVVGSVTYLPFFASGASTVSPIFHTLDTFRGTLVFDEADFRFSDEKAELVKILNNGNARGFPVLRTRMTERREFDPQAFVVFGPKIVGMRRTYEDRALESRFLSIDMPPGKSSGIPINLPEAQEAEALDLRNRLLMYRIRNRHTLKLDTSLVDPNLEPRTNQILLPLLSVLPDEAMRASVKRIASARETGFISERGMTVEGKVLEILSSRSLDRLSLKEIVAAVAETHGTDYDRPVTSRYIGSVLRRLGLVLYKSDGVYVLAPGQHDLATALYARYGIAGDNMGKNAQPES